METTAANFLTENVIKQIAKEVVKINEERKAQNKRIDYMADKVFDECRKNYTHRLNAKFGYKADHYKKNEDGKNWCRETFDLYKDIFSAALKAAGVMSERHAYLEGKSEVANAFAEELCEAILKED